MGALGHISKMQRPMRLPARGPGRPGGRSPLGRSHVRGRVALGSRFQLWCAFVLCAGVTLSSPGAAVAAPGTQGGRQMDWAERALRQCLSEDQKPPDGAFDVRVASARPSEVSRRQLLDLAADAQRTGDALLRVELARALRRHQTPHIDNAITLALLSLLDHPTKSDAPGSDQLALETAAMALVRSSDPLARRALAARAKMQEATPARAAARLVLGQRTSGRKKNAKQSAPLTKKQVAGRLEGLLALLEDDAAATRFAVSQQLTRHLKTNASPKERIWIAGAAAERYRAEWSVEVRGALVTLLIQTGRTPASQGTLALAADLDPDATIRHRAAKALPSQFGDEG